MGYFSDLDIDNQELEAINGGFKPDYEPDHTDIKGKAESTPQNALSLSNEQREYIKSEQFANEWEDFLKGAF